MGSTEHIMSRLGEEEVAQVKDSFFQKVLARIDLTDEEKRLNCEIRYRELPIHGSEERKPFYASNDSITELWVQERTVATCVELRDSFNFAQILLADYLSDELIEMLRDKIKRTT